MKNHSFTILLILLISMISTNAFADATGKCGANLTWTYVEATGTLTISGSGAMYDYSYSSSSTRSPWYNYSEMIKKAVIEGGVTSIGEYAFYGCFGLTSVSIPNSVKSIGNHAFIYCSGLTSVTIPNSVTSIGTYAFEYCSGLTSITIPNSVTSIGDRAFYGCSGLTSITIPNGVTSIGDHAFYGCSGLTSVTIPNSVTSIGNYAFSDCHGLTSVTIPNSETSIGDYAFFGCSGLTSVTIPNSVTNIGDCAFGNCSGLSSIKVVSGNIKYDSRNNCNAIIETSTNTLISGCKNTTVPNSVTSIGDGAFAFCSDLTSITIPNSVTSIGDYAFEYCPGLTSVTIPNSVTSIGDGAFYGCSGLTSVTIPNSVTRIGGMAFSGCTGLTSVTIPSSVTSIGVNAFWGCSNLTSVTVENKTPVKIGSDTFTNRKNATLYVPSGCKAAYLAANYWKEFKEIIESNSNKCGDNLTWTYVQATQTLTISGSGAMYNYDYYSNNSPWYSYRKNIKTAVIEGGVTSIGNYAFQDCSGLTSITIPNSVTSIGGGAFEGCSGLTSVTIPNSVTSIGLDAFSGTAWYDNQPNGLVYAGKVAYEYKGTMPENTNLAIKEGTLGIAGGAFFHCSGLVSITIPNSVTSIGEYAFSCCSGLTSITIPNSVTSIGDYAFGNYSNLTSVTIENKTPIAISSGTFTNSKNATLFVPFGCKAAYMAANYWKEFKEIVEAVEVTDISKMTNAIYVEPASGRVGDDMSIKVCLKNANAATSYGFELVLPQGLSIATTSDGGFDGAVTKSARHNGHTLTTNKVANNTYKVGVASLSSKALTDNDGLVLTIKAHVADNMAVGDYPILIQNPLIVNTDGTKPAVQNTQSKITIEDYKKGDVDGDGVVDLADAVLVINHYVGKPVNKFVAKAADVDGDGVIDLADAVRIINFYVGKVQSLAPSVGLGALDPQ